MKKRWLSLLMLLSVCLCSVSGCKKDDTNAVQKLVIDGNDIVYSKADASSQLDLAYAMTIHKSQGSSINHVILVTPKAHKFFLDRNLLYVASSRSRKTLDHVGTYDVVSSALRKSANKSRNTHLKEFLMNRFI